MSPRWFRPALRLRTLIRAAAFSAALLALLVFASAASAADPTPTGTITTGPSAVAPVVLPGYVSPYDGNPYGAPIIVPGVIPPGTDNGITCDGLYGCPVALPAFGTGTTYVQGNLYCGLYVCGVVQPIQR